MSSAKVQTVHIDPPQVSRPKRAPRSKGDSRSKRQPRYQVILWDDNDHTYQYVVRMMRELFRLTTSQAMDVAVQVDKSGRATCLTTTREHAELKRDQIHAYGKDALIASCAGSMRASIEPLPAN